MADRYDSRRVNRSGRRVHGSRRRRKKNLRRRLIAYGLRLLCILVIAGGLILIGRWIFGGNDGDDPVGEAETQGVKTEVVIPSLGDLVLPSFINDASLPINPYSRPGHYTTALNAIVFHAAEGQRVHAVELRDSYEQLMSSALRRESSNFIVGDDGTILMCVPPGEIAYASDSRDMDTVSVTYCSMSENGEVSEEARLAMVKLAAWLCEEYDIPAENLLRHYDVSGRTCPAYYVSNSKTWTAFMESVKEELAAEEVSGGIFGLKETAAQTSATEGSVEEPSSVEEDGTQSE